MKGRPKKYQNPEEAKKARNEQIRLWRLKNKDRIKLIVKEYHKKNPDIIEKSHKKYQTKNKDLILERTKKSNIKRIIKDKYAKDKYANVDDEFILKKIKEYKPIKRIPSTKYMKLNGKYKLAVLQIEYRNCNYCNKLIVSRKSSIRKYCNSSCSSKYIYQNRKVDPNYKHQRKVTRKKYRLNYPEKIKSSLKRYYSSEKGQITHLWDTLRKRIKTYTFSKVQTSRKDMDKLTGCSKFFLLKFIESKFYDHPITNKKMTWSNIKDWHIDHITPLAVLDPKKDEHFKIANHFSNLQPMWANENLRKGANVTPGYGVAHLKRKYKKLQSLGDLTNISTKSEADVVLNKISKLI